MATTFDPANQEHVGKRCRWTVYGLTFTGTIYGVVAERKHGLELPGDWYVNVDRGGTAAVIGAEHKLI